MDKYDLDAMVVLEDDIYPSKAFFSYVKNMSEKYIYDDRIEGVSLYSFARNPMTLDEFAAADTWMDVYFMQFACSWGQVWFREKWKKFKKWYLEHSDSEPNKLVVPDAVAKWPESSWLKHHIRYCAENNRFFVFNSSLRSF